MRQVRRKGTDPQRLVWHTADGITVQPRYGSDDVPETSGVLWDHNAWQIRVDIPAGEGNAAALTALEGGADALGFGTQVDGDLPMLLRSIPLDKTPLHWDGGDVRLLKRLANAAEALGFEPADLHGTMGPDANLESEALPAVIELSRAAESTRWRTLRVDVRPYHRGGATMVQELAFAAASTAALLSRLGDAGLRPDAIAPKLHYDICTGTSFLPEVAKLRALRHLVSQVLRAFGAADTPVFVHAETSLRSHSMLDGATNAVRASSQAVSAIVGGCNALTVAIPDRALARHLQLLLRHEAQLGVVSDPGAGAYYIEALTDALGRRAWRLMQDLEAQGGISSPRTRARMREMVRAARRRSAAAVDAGAESLVGVNIYPTPDAVPTHALPAQDGESAGLPPFRAALRFEAVRRQAAELAAHLGHRPAAYLAGPSSPLKVLARRVLESGGFEVLLRHPASADVWVRCGPDAPGAASADQVVVSVSEAADDSALNIFRGCDMPAVLERLLDRCHGH